MRLLGVRMASGCWSVAGFSRSELSLRRLSDEASSKMPATSVVGGGLVDGSGKCRGYV